MEEHIVRIIDVNQVTHDVRRLRVEKPAGYTFIPGQATEVSINTPQLRDEKRPFTFTGLNKDPFLEFIIKIYPSHKGVTGELARLKPGAELIIRDVWGTISYKGPGTFIAGGAGITPFIAILRELRDKKALSGNSLIFANKTSKDIILEDELRDMLGNRFINILSDEMAQGCFHGLIDGDFLKTHITDFGNMFYVCGPSPMTDSVIRHMNSLGVAGQSIILER